MSDFRESDPYLQKRYGLGKRSLRWFIPAIICLSVGGGWLAWTAWFHIHNTVSTQIITYSPISAQKLRVNYSFKVGTKGVRYSCTFVALDAQTNVVGEVSQTLPIGPSHGGDSVIIATRIPASSATIDSCIAVH
jgi:hypothetical protein